jgi:hypothetical protein
LQQSLPKQLQQPGDGGERLKNDPEVKKSAQFSALRLIPVNFSVSNRSSELSLAAVAELSCG